METNTVTAAETFPIPAAGERISYSMRVGGVPMTITYTARGGWSLTGEDELIAKVGEVLASEWLISFWGTGLGAHIWALGNPCMA